MDNIAYFESLTSEIKSLQNRIRNFIGNAHWQSDGEWKESVLKSILRRYLPNHVGVGSGFIITPDGPSTQIDILIYDKSKPILFSDGDFVLVTQDATLGIIEVKTKVRSTELPDVLRKLDANVSLSRKGYACVQPFFGLFVYECQNFASARTLATIKDVFKGMHANTINFLCFDKSFFIRYWNHDPTYPSNSYYRWHCYNLNRMAPAYFIHNVIEHTCHYSVLMNNDLWFPSQGKEPNKIAEIEQDRTMQK